MGEQALMRFWVRMVKAISLAIAFCSVVYSAFAIGPAVETRWFPVVGKLIILKTDATPDGGSKVWAAFEKKRNCEYLGIAWFAGDRNNSFERVPIILGRDPDDTSSPNRPVGYQKAGPWMIPIPPDALAGNSFAQLFHRCHPFYTTTTEFFP